MTKREQILALCQAAEDLERGGAEPPPDSATVFVVDFDGVLTQGDLYPDLGPLDTEIVGACCEAQERGDAIIVSTCRVGALLEEALAALRGWGLIPDAVNDNHPARVARWGSNPRKVSGDIILDDRAVGYTREGALAALRRSAKS